MKADSFDSLIGFKKPLFISDSKGGGDAHSIDDWVKASIYLGRWAKDQFRDDFRRITFVVTPCRESVTPFVALGVLLSSISNYKDGLSWNKFSTLNSGVEIYWKKNESPELYIGKVIGVEPIGSEPAIKLEITRSRKAKDVGSIIFIPEEQFNKFQFSLEKPASSQRQIEINASIAFLERLIGDVSPAWAKSDGQDLLLVTKMMQFKTSLEGLIASLDGSNSQLITLESLLGFEQLGDSRQSKMKISHPRGELKSDASIVILDGPSAFSIREHIPLKSDLLIILDSGEFNENEFEFINELENFSEADDAERSDLIPAVKFPVGFEVTSYSFAR